MSPRLSKSRWSYESARTREDAIEAARCALGCLDDLADVDLGHDGDHLAAEARKNLRAVETFLRRAPLASPHPWLRLDGVFHRIELESVIDVEHEFYVSDAGQDADGVAVYRIYCRPCAAH